MWLERRYLRQLDAWLLLAFAGLSGLGLAVLSSAAGEPLSTLLRPEAWLRPAEYGFAQRQALWLLLGLLAMAATLAVDYRSLTRWWHVIYGVTLAGLGLVLVMGDAALGAQRWIDIGPFSLQPSEFAKLGMIVVLATVLARLERPADRWGDLVVTGAYLLPPLVLVLIQPDLGTGLVLLAITAGMLLMAGMPPLRLGLLGGGGLAVMVAWVALHLTRGVWIPLAEYQIRRLIVFLDPTADRYGAGYQIIESQYAIGSGRLWGRGLYQGLLNKLQYLPEQHTDFIFSVLGEELGFVGAAATLLLFALLLQRILRIALLARDDLGALLAAGVASMLAFHLIVNVGMTVGLMPVTGIPLPFLSYGGSAMVVDCAALGLVLNVGMRRHKILFGA